MKEFRTLSGVAKAHDEDQATGQTAMSRDGGVDLDSRWVSLFAGMWCILTRPQIVRCHTLQPGIRLSSTPPLQEGGSFGMEGFPEARDLLWGLN